MSHLRHRLDECCDIGIKLHGVRRIFTPGEAVRLCFTIIDVVFRWYIVRHKFCDLFVRQRDPQRKLRFGVS